LATLPTGKLLNQTSIFSQALRFSASSFPSSSQTSSSTLPPDGDLDDGAIDLLGDGYSLDGERRRGIGGERQGDLLDSITGSVSSGGSDEESDDMDGDDGWSNSTYSSDTNEMGNIDVTQSDSVTSGQQSDGVATYSTPITYAVAKTGYYCVGESRNPCV
jgi:hypothetical protein